jgi:deltex-like protein
MVEETKTKRTNLHMADHEDEQCSICMCPFDESEPAVQMGKCDDHFFHAECLVHCKGRANFIKCPICGSTYGIITGDMPKGTMRYKRHPVGELPCEGYEEYGTILVEYRFPNGRRGAQSYAGTNRTAFLPDTPEGNEILRLLQIAFDRRLSFTVGTSITTGRPNCVIWNGIHHKTNTTGGSSEFGYPDETYFKRVKEELAAKGVIS